MFRRCPGSLDGSTWASFTSPRQVAAATGRACTWIIPVPSGSRMAKASRRVRVGGWSVMAWSQGGRNVEEPCMADDGSKVNNWLYDPPKIRQISDILYFHR